MSLIESRWIGGVCCDVRDCEVAYRLPELAPYFEGIRTVERDVLTVGWAKRIGRSTRWYCPSHADRAGRCVRGAWGRCSRHCPVHGHGRVVTKAAGTR